MSQLPNASGAMQPSGGLPRVQPASVFGIFICCIGYVWTALNYFQALSGINKIDPSANLQAWTLFVPVYANLYLSTVIQALNRNAQARGLQPIDDNIVLNLFVPLLPIYKIFGLYNQLADAVEGRKA